MSCENYDKICFLGEGQFATVYKAKCNKTNEIVAIKKINVGNREEISDGIHRTAYREIKILRELSHQNIITLIDVFMESQNACLVFNFMDTDMEEIIQDKSIVLNESHLKNYYLQLCLGVEYLHYNWILHRDLKPNNILLNQSGVLKITDFGLAKAYGNVDQKYTSQVVTLWYRCPELLLGCRKYSTNVDVWAIGCIFCELYSRKPLFTGNSEIDQLGKIFKVTGPPTVENWPNHVSIPEFLKFEYNHLTPLKIVLPSNNDIFLNLLNNMLLLNPLKRFNCTQVIDDIYFKNKPYPCKNSHLPFHANKKQTAKSDSPPEKKFPNQNFQPIIAPIAMEGKKEKVYRKIIFD